MIRLIVKLYLTPITSSPNLHLVILSTQKASDLRVAFPVPQLTLITSAPAHQTIHIIHTELKSNVAGVHSPNSTFSHLALTISQFDYLLKNSNLFPVPVNPGTAPSVT